MGTRIRLAISAAGAAVVAAVLLGTFMPASGQAQSSATPRTADGKPDFTGNWQAMNTANWDLQAHEACHGPVVALGAAFSVPAGIGVVEGNEIPYLPAAAAKKKDNQENWLARDPDGMASTSRVQHDQRDGFGTFGFQPTFIEASARERFIGEPLSQN